MLRPLTDRSGFTSSPWPIETRRSSYEQIDKTKTSLTARPCGRRGQRRSGRVRQSAGIAAGRRSSADDLESGGVSGCAGPGGAALVRAAGTIRRTPLAAVAVHQPGAAAVPALRGSRFAGGLLLRLVWELPDPRVAGVQHCADAAPRGGQHSVQDECVRPVVQSTGDRRGPEGPVPLRTDGEQQSAHDPDAAGLFQAAFERIPTGFGHGQVSNDLPAFADLRA